MASRYREVALEAPASGHMSRIPAHLSSGSTQAVEKLSRNQINPSVQAAGTVVANKGTDTGVLHGASLGRRRSTGLRSKDCENLILAARHAILIGRPLNRMLTIHFDAAGIADPVKATGRLLKLIGDWLRCFNTEITAVWVREAGPEKGEHVHILLSVPPDKITAFNRLQRGWFKRIGASWRRGVYLSRPIGPSSQTAFNAMSADLYQQELSGAVRYLLKGADVRARAAHRIRRYQDGGELWGKRCGTTENIGKAARDRFRALK